MFVFIIKLKNARSCAVWLVYGKDLILLVSNNYSDSHDSGSKLTHSKVQNDTNPINDTLHLWCNQGVLQI